MLSQLDPTKVTVCVGNNQLTQSMMLPSAFREHPSDFLIPQHGIHQVPVPFMPNMISNGQISTLEDIMPYYSVKSENSQHQSHESYVQFDKPSKAWSECCSVDQYELFHQNECEQPQFLSENLDGVQRLTSGISTPTGFQSKRTEGSLLMDFYGRAPDRPNSGNYFDVLPSLKRQKMENPMCTSPNENETSHQSAPSLVQPCTPEGLVNLKQKFDVLSSINSEVHVVDMEDNVNANSSKSGSRTVPVLPKELSFDHKEKEVKVRSETYQTEPEIENKSTAPETNCAKEIQSGNMKIRGVSLTEFFNAEQLKEHILSLRKWVGKVSTLYYCFGYVYNCFHSAFSCMVLYISIIFWDIHNHRLHFFF